MSKLRDLTGQKFGRLVVVERAGTCSYKSAATWLCLCDCGNFTTVLSERLCLTKSTRSCGCLKKELARERAPALHLGNVKPGAAFNRVLSNYKAGAKGQGVIFSLTVKSFKELITSVCFYCGAKPENTSVAQSGETLSYNGIDKLDFKLGYVKDNCVTCCKVCNWMKQRLSLDAFISHVKCITSHWEKTHGNL